MIATSSEYQASIAERTMRRTFGKIEVNYTDPFVDTSIVVHEACLATEDTTILLDEDGTYLEFEPDLSRVTYKGQVADGVLYPSSNWFALDGSSLLDGTFKLAPPGDDALSELNNQTGWWSYDVAGAGGTFADPAILTVDFYVRTIELLMVCSDSIKGEYPVDFTIELYDAAGTVLYTETVTGNTATYWTKYITPVALVVSQSLIITKWSHAGRCAKIYEFFTAIKRTYLSDDIFSMSLLEEAVSDQVTLPVGNISSNQFSFKVFNFGRQFDAGSGSAIANLIKPMRRVMPYIGAAGLAGETEWIPLGVFWTQEWDVSDENMQAGSLALDLFSLMAKTEYTPGLLANQTLYDIIESACMDFGLSASSYWIDPSLDVDVIPYAYITKTNHREAIRIAAAAGPAMAYVNRLGVLRVEGVDYWRQNNVSSVKTIEAYEYFTRSNPSRFSQISNIVNVNTSPLTSDAASSSVYQNTNVLAPAGRSIVVTASYTDTPVINASASILSPPTGVSITATTYYPWGADITVTNAGSSDHTIEIDVLAKVLRVTGGGNAQARDEASISEFGEHSYTLPCNPLIQNVAVAQAIADKLLSLYSNARRDLSQEWRGDPAIEIGDQIKTDDARTTQAYYNVLRQEISWDGTLRSRHDALMLNGAFNIMTEDGSIIETEDNSLLE